MLGDWTPVGLRAEVDEETVELGRRARCIDQRAMAELFPIWRDHLEHARRLLREGRLEEAEAEITAALIREPESLQAQALRSRISVMRNRQPGAGAARFKPAPAASWGARAQAAAFTGVLAMTMGAGMVAGADALRWWDSEARTSRSEVSRPVSSSAAPSAVPARPAQPTVAPVTTSPAAKVAEKQATPAPAKRQVRRTRRPSAPAVRTAVRQSEVTRTNRGPSKIGRFFKRTLPRALGVGIERDPSPSARQ